jgi:hypothetical protein
MGPSLSDNDAHQLNEQSITEAAEKIANRNLVVIYPEGPLGKEGKWMDGIGYLLFHLRHTKEAYIVFAHVSGTSDKDILRLVPGVSRFFPTVKVDFSSPIPVQRVVGHLTAIDPKDKAAVKKIAKGLTSSQARDYKQWIEGIDKTRQPAEYFRQIAAVIGPHAPKKEVTPIQFQLDPSRDNEAFMAGYRQALVISGLDMPKIEEEIQDVEIWLLEAKTAGKRLNIEIAPSHRVKWMDN